MIARFFKEIGRMDELGSGVRNVFRYCRIYTPGTEPEFIEGDIFKTIIPLKVEDRATQISTQIISKRILELLRQNPSISRKKLLDEWVGQEGDGMYYMTENATCYEIFLHLSI